MVSESVLYCEFLNLIKYISSELSADVISIFLPGSRPLPFPKNSNSPKSKTPLSVRSPLTEGAPPASTDSS